MQSNNSFSVGGSISVNCHGWQFDRPPIAATVKSLRLMQADGTIVRCGRTENQELFSLVLGGYGLFGVILDVDLLNVTVREINTDNDSFLRYADQNMFSFVMLFVLERNPAGESRMIGLTRDLIDAALRAGGRYYLPYRLHATPEQFHRAYPQAAQFFELKREYDPDGLFQNEFSRKYGSGRANE